MNVIPVRPAVVVRTATLADRLDVARAAQRVVGVSHDCEYRGCTKRPSERVHGRDLCSGHAAFQWVREVRGAAA